MFQRILVPLDGSRASFDAFDWAVAIARPEQALITALCVIDVRVSHEAQVYLPLLEDEIGVSYRSLSPADTTAVYQEWSQKIIDKARNRSAAVHVSINTEIVQGIPYKEIISRSSKHDLLVMGGWQMSSDYPGPFLAGRTFWQVVSRTGLPALHVFGEPQKVKTILAVYDDAPAARDALQLTATWAKIWNLTLVVLTIQSNGHQAQTLLQEARRRVEPLNPRLIAREGDPGTVIKEIAAEHQCDLLSLGVPPHHLWQGYSLGEVIDDLLYTGSLPLLLSH
jgi:nucleotide-binding universal stress UspA family protein